MSQKHLCIILAGAGAAGKTTTTQAFARGEPQEFREERMCKMRDGMQPKHVLWTLYDNCGVAGNHNSGTDANTGPGIIKVAFEEVLKERRIVIVDGYLSTPRWMEMCNDWDAAHIPDKHLDVLLVHFDLTPEELLGRLAERRGVTKDDIREKMFPKMQANAKRPIGLIDHFERSCELAWEVVTVYADDDTETIVGLMDEAVADIMHEEDFQWPA